MGVLSRKQTAGARKREVAPHNVVVKITPEASGIAAQATTNVSSVCRLGGTSHLSQDRCLGPHAINAEQPIMVFTDCIAH